MTIGYLTYLCLSADCRQTNHHYTTLTAWHPVGGAVKGASGHLRLPFRLTAVRMLVVIRQALNQCANTAGDRPHLLPIFGRDVERHAGERADGDTGRTIGRGHAGSVQATGRRCFPLYGEGKRELGNGHEVNVAGQSPCANTNHSKGFSP